jgi:predicted SAM-dependent methyltransferase
LRWGYQPIKMTRRAVQQWRWRPRIRRLVAEYLAEPGFKGLNVGCGPFQLEGWLNTELLGSESQADFPQDITRPLAFPDRSLDAVYASEVIEHVDRDSARRFFVEARRVLRDGGVLRLTTPDVVEVCRLFLNQRDDVSLDQFAATWIDGEFSPEIWINAQFRAYGHQHLWSFAELTRALQEAGFDKTVRCAPLQTLSPIPQLRDLETRYGADAPPWLFARTLIVEGEKTRTPAAELRPGRRVGEIAAERRHSSQTAEQAPHHTSTH